jgi:formylglycine-generating enzyme required for sulfatase activity
LRGGSWNNNPRNLRVSNRNNNDAGNRNDNNGFRCSREAIRSGASGRGQSRAHYL